MKELHYCPECKVVFFIKRGTKYKPKYCRMCSRHSDANYILLLMNDKKG